MTASIYVNPDKPLVGKAFARRDGAISRRKMGSLMLSFLAAGLFARAARRATPGQSPTEYVIVDGWLLRSDDLV